MVNFWMKPTKTQGKCWKFQWRRQCLAKKNKEALRVSLNWSEEWWILQYSQNKACMHRGGARVHEKTSGTISTEGSWRSHRSYNLVHTFLPLPQAMNIPEAKAAAHKEWKKLETIPAWKLDKVKSEKEVILEAQRDKKKVHSATLMDICQLKNAELEPTIPEVQGKSCASRRHCERRLWNLCSLYWKGLVCVSNDSSRSNGCHCKITRFWRTSSWCSFGLYSDKIGGRFQIAQNIWIRVSRRMDTSSTTETAEIMVQYGRPSRSSWAKSVRSSFGRTVMGKAIWENPIEVRLGEGFQLGMLVR